MKSLYFLTEGNLELLNSHYLSIKFTLELGGSKINFLDLTISVNDGKHTFSIFRKPTHTDGTIHNSSFHLACHKHAAFLSMIHRLVSVPVSSLSFEKERSIIQHIAKANDINLDTDQLIHKKRVSRVLDLTTTHSRLRKDRHWIRLPHVGKQ